MRRQNIQPAKDRSELIDLTGGETRSSRTINFDPTLVTLAISFHLLEDGIARSIEEASMRRAVARMRRDGLQLNVRASEWAVFTNGERLKWLLNESHTTIGMRPGGVAVMESTDK